MKKAKGFTTLEENEVEQLSTYLREGVVPITTDPLAFWKAKENSMPNLCKVCRVLYQKLELTTFLLLIPNANGKSFFSSFRSIFAFRQRLRQVSDYSPYPVSSQTPEETA